MGVPESFTYDANGFMTRRTDRNGTVFNMTFDQHGRLRREEAVVQGVVTGFTEYEFWFNGLLARQYNGTHFINFSYDAQGRVSILTEIGVAIPAVPASAGSPALPSNTVIQLFSYNAANNRTRLRTSIDGVWQPDIVN